MQGFLSDVYGFTSYNEEEKKDIVLMFQDHLSNFKNTIKDYLPTNEKKENSEETIDERENW